MKTYNLTVTEEQARILTNALDLFSRIGIGQLERVIDDFIHLEGMTPEKIEISRKYIDAAKLTLTGFPPNASHGIRSPNVSDDYRIAYDLQQVIRNRLAWDRNPQGGIQVHYHDPHQTSTTQDLATIADAEGVREKA